MPGTHHHTIAYLDSILRYLEVDIRAAEKRMETEERGSNGWCFAKETLFGYESSRRYLIGAKEMARLEQRWNEEAQTK